MQVIVNNTQHDIAINIESVQGIVVWFLKKQKLETNEVYVHFVSDEELSVVHDELFNDPSLTDTISVPIDLPTIKSYPHVLGEIFISVKAAYRFFANKRIDAPTPTQIYEEITRYLIHSLLHLIGFDDIDPSERKKMKNKENSLMCMLKKKHFLIN